MFSRNMTNSIARNNSVSNEDRGIVISESSENEIYNIEFRIMVAGLIWMRILSITIFIIISL
jgi:parallel beta-helix repeat protein